MFRIDHEVLKRLCKINEFKTKPNKTVIFGLRGLQPAAPSNFDFASSHKVGVADVNYKNLRCTIGIWSQQDEKIALFAASTVPYEDWVDHSSKNKGIGTNQLLESCVEHKKGWHFAYKALRQNSPFAVQRVVNDHVYDFDEDDKVEVGIQGDNIHASRCDSLAHTFFSSRGCQVIIGHPPSGGMGGTSGWKIFQKHIYELKQKRFKYVLLKGYDAQEAATAPQNTVSARVRFGSHGQNTRSVQESLHDRGFGSLVGRVDDEFGGRTLMAIRALQSGKGITPDGIVGPSTADSLGLDDWPRY